MSSQLQRLLKQQIPTTAGSWSRAEDGVSSLETKTKARISRKWSGADEMFEGCCVGKCSTLHILYVLPLPFLRPRCIRTSRKPSGSSSDSSQSRSRSQAMMMHSIAFRCPRLGVVCTNQIVAHVYPELCGINHFCLCRNIVTSD